MTLLAPRMASVTFRLGILHTLSYNKGVKSLHLTNKPRFQLSVNKLLTGTLGDCADCWLRESTLNSQLSPGDWAVHAAFQLLDAAHVAGHLRRRRPCCQPAYCAQGLFVGSHDAAQASVVAVAAQEVTRRASARVVAARLSRSTDSDHLRS